MKQMGSKNTPQWNHVRRAREGLVKSSNFPVPDEFESAWRILEERYGCLPHAKPFLDRDKVENVSAYPLGALMTLVELGFYPPPELLLGLLESWREYLESDGMITLEEAFLGKPRRKGGNYAMRQGRSMQNMRIAIEMAEKIRSGMTRERAAEETVNKLHLNVDADSIVRISRRLPFYKKKIAKPKAEK